ncbi:sporulation integral membrane protein YtvI [Pradoshia eiseniae]|uniref:Sporulation integral membrane protein YtvI n=1 Tax=Pradoshia eiseniae TaxID=2064768 RepID=A0A2S7MY23_9BACI|nr:sporulation integral membrane protein YtvI [Pradoshia eiseniae]PQD94655.1 sporulation integral membrane protein YtvI [Pradoshia eiseniae]
MNFEYLYRALRFIMVITGSVITIYLLLLTAKYTYPFIIGICLAFLMNPFITFTTEKLRFPRALSVLVSMIVVIALIAGLITFLITEIVAGAAYLSNVLPEHLDNMIKLIQDFFQSRILPLYERIISLFNDLEDGQQDTILSNIENIGSSIGTTLTNLIQTTLGFVPKLIGWLPGAGTGALFSLLATFFIAKEWNKFLAKTQQLLPAKALFNIKKIIVELERALFGFIRAQLTLITITTLIVLLGLLILRIEFAITIALITGFVDLLPYLGTGFVFVPWIIYALMTGNFSLALGLAILYTVVIVQRQVMEPKILSSSIGLDPLITLIAIFVGFKTIGFIGLIIGPIVLIIIRSLYKLRILHDVWDFIMGRKPTEFTK